MFPRAENFVLDAPFEEESQYFKHAFVSTTPNTISISGLEWCFFAVQNLMSMLDWQVLPEVILATKLTLNYTNNYEV